MHAGEMLRQWREQRDWSAARLARELPDQLADGQMIYRYEQSPIWLGSAPNALWLIDQGAFPKEAILPNPPEAKAATRGKAVA